MVLAFAYVKETLIYAEIIRLLPRFFYPIIGPIIARRFNSHNVIFETLVPIAEQRVFERDIKNLGREVPRHEDCIQWIMDTSPRVKPWTAERVIHEVMAIWFGSVHALSTTITFAMHDLCLHPEYLEPIRQELAADYETFERTSSGLPLLDSFIKESARLTPVESMSTRRSALQPFTLSDGTKLAIGDWACTPVRAIMQDPESYPSPMDFNGFRFVNEDVLSRIGSSIASAQAVPNQKPSKLTDVDNTWHVWGTGRMACPGRWYAVAVMKVIVGQLVMNYNFELINSQESRYFTWRSTMLPKHNTMLAFTPRESVAH